jgi:hypothetical protein
MSDTDPVLEGLPLESNLGCAVPYYKSPYFRASAPSFAWSSPAHIAVAAALASLSYLFTSYY